MRNVVYTIGHSSHSIEKLIELLTAHDVTAVADVRSRPYSRFRPHFNRESLSSRLKEAGIAYVFFGRELGGRPEDRACYVEGTVQYDRLARTSLFQEGLRRVAGGVKRHRISLLCAEEDPLVCHRGILVCRHLATKGIEAMHIRESGRLDGHDEALARLIKDLGLPERDLFRTSDTFVDEAYDRRGRQIAYTEKDFLMEEPLREARR